MTLPWNADVFKKGHLAMLYIYHLLTLFLTHFALRLNHSRRTHTMIPNSYFLSTFWVWLRHWFFAGVSYQIGKLFQSVIKFVLNPNPKEFSFWCLVSQINRCECDVTVHSEKTRFFTIFQNWIEKSAKLWMRSFIKISQGVLKNDSTVFENHRKSRIQHCERSELCLYFWVDKNALKMPKIVNFGDFFENLKVAMKQCYQTGHF